MGGKKEDEKTKSQWKDSGAKSHTEPTFIRLARYHLLNDLMPGASIRYKIDIGTHLIIAGLHSPTYYHQHGTSSGNCAVHLVCRLWSFGRCMFGHYR